MTPEERGRAFYESGDADDPPWESLTPTERAAWIAQALSDDEVLWSQWRPEVLQ